MIKISLKLALLNLMNRPFSRFFLIGTIAFILFISAIMWAFLEQFEKFLKDIKDSQVITAYLSYDISEIRQNEIRKMITELEGVKKAESLSKKELLKKFNQFFPKLTADLEGLDNDILPTLINIYVDEKKLNQVQNDLKKISEIEFVDTHFKRYESLFKALMSMKSFIAFLLLGSIITLISLIFNHFKIDTLQRYQVTQTLNLLGSTWWMTSLVFIFEGLIEGVLGGSLSALLLLNFSKFFEQYWFKFISALGFLVSDFNLKQSVVLVLVVGVISGVIGSGWAAFLSIKNQQKNGTKRFSKKFLNLQIFIFISLLFFVEQKNSFSEELSKKNNLEVIEKKIKTIQANISEIETELLKTNSQNITAKQQLYKIRKLIALQKEEIFYSEKKINELSRSLKALEAEKQKIIDLLNYRKKRLYRRLVDLATLLQESPFDVAWVQSYEDIIIREAVFQSLTEKDIKLVQELKQNTDEALALELRLIEEKNQIEYYIQELKSQSSLLAANEEIQKEIIKTNRVARLENLKSIQELKKAEKELTMVFNQVQSTSSSAKYGFALLKGKLQSPIEGKIKNKYGRFYDQKTNLFTFNKGITIEAQKNSPVKAVAEGRVVFSGPLKHYGLIVILEHAGQYYTLYGQLSQVLVKENDFVKMSTVIGLSSDEPVYFEIRNKNIAVNPMEWLKEKS